MQTVLGLAPVAPRSAVLSASDKRFYRPGLDVLRFLAFFSVFLSHGLLFYKALPLVVRLALQGGMCLFFVLSSYLITELLLREQQETGQVHVQAFFVRRILRIWPLYFTALVLAIMTGLIWRFVWPPGACLLAYLLLIGNWYNILRGSMNSPWQPLWSINLEEQFYLLWPFLASKGRIYIWIVALCTFPVAALTLLYWTGKLANDSMGVQVWFNSFVQFQYFGLGAILALVLNGRSLHWRLYQQILLWASSAALFYVAVFVLVRGQAQTSRSLIVGYLLIGAACVTLFLSLLDDRSSKLREPFVELGKISYGLYVFHNPCLFATAQMLKHIPGATSHNLRFGVANLILGLLLTLIAAKLSYRFLEKPFLRLKQRFEFVKTRSV